MQVGCYYHPIRRMWVMSVLFIVKVTLWFHHILPRYHGYACDCTWFMRDSIELIYKNAILFARFCTNCEEKRSYTYQDTSTRLHGG